MVAMDLSHLASPLDGGLGDVGGGWGRDGNPGQPG